ncbi:MAG: hypothetical protein GXO75_05740, partial [Calditrichaeota bacterium]|nr:hypothetical protein [Calditrichota bacterium]
SEPFPTGIVEESGVFSVKATWQPAWWLRILGEGVHWDIRNLGNQNGVNDSYWEWRISINVDVVHTWEIP